MQPTSTATSPCTCGWNHDNQTNAAPVVVAAAAPHARPQKEIDFGILRKPDPRGNVGDVRGIYKCYKQVNCFDFEVFGYADGKCPHCKSSNIEAGDLNKSVKLIFTTGKPRFVQGIGLRCTECNGKGWQSFEKTFVDTLPQWKQHELHAIIVGKSNGVDMDLILRMRMGETAAEIEDTCRANLELYHSALQDKYDENCRVATQRGYDVVNQDFPGLDPSLVAKQDVLTNAFLKDYVTVRSGLLREISSLKSEETILMEHQYEVSRRAIRKKAGCSCTIVGDGGIVLGYYAVPDDGEEWLKASMMEMMQRHRPVLGDDLFLRQ